MAASERVFGKGDANRHALHDLGEIARGVFGRQHREDRTGGRSDGGHRAFERLITIGVHMDRNLGAGHQIGDLRLLEIGLDVELVCRNESREPLAGGNEVTGLHR